LDLLLNVHFPDSDETKRGTVFAPYCRTGRLDWWTAARVVTYQRVGWAIDSFAPYKSPGVDRVFPALLQQGQEVLIPHLTKIFRACLATGFVSAICRQVKVVFIPKPDKVSYRRSKDFRPISLTSLLLKTMERLVDRFLGTKFWPSGHFIPTSMHTRPVGLWKRPFISSCLRVEKALDQKDIALGVFLDI
jgi:hypothetical protein